jgi:hypothetical protein
VADVIGRAGLVCGSSLTDGPFVVTIRANGTVRGWSTEIFSDRVWKNIDEKLVSWKAFSNNRG